MQKQLKDYLSENVSSWQMAEEIYRYYKNKELLSEIEIKMIQDFLSESEKNQSLSEEIANSFEPLLKDKIKMLSHEIIDAIMSVFPQLKSGEFGGLAKHEHYINFDLENKIRVQFRYSRYPYFNLKSIWIQFYQTGIAESEMKTIVQKIDQENYSSFKWNSVHKAINHKFIDDDHFYDTILNQEERLRIATSHSRIYDIIGKLIQIYDINFNDN